MKGQTTCRTGSIVLTALLIGLILIFLYVDEINDETRGTLISTKGGEAGNLSQWVTYRSVFEQLNLAWARIPVDWSRIETSDGGYDWSSQEYSQAKSAIQSAREMGAGVILTIKNAPGFLIDQNYASRSDGTPAPWPSPCGRITAQGIEHLASFANALLDHLAGDLGGRSRQSAPVDYVELWNEPDIAADQVPSPSNYGCWQRGATSSLALSEGSVSKAYEAGSYYARVINAVVPIVKQRHPTVKFVAGAAASTSSGFLAAVVDQAVENFDVLSYHQYTSSTNQGCDVAEAIRMNEKTFNEVRGYLDAHSGQDKSILISEGAMGYASPPQTLEPLSTQTPAPAFYDCQAQYASGLLTWTNQKAEQGKLLGFIWYTIGINGWAETDLLYPNKTPKPVFSAWKQ